MRVGTHPANPQSAIRNPLFKAPMTNLPYRVEKPWGYELIWAKTDRYVGKILHIEPGHVLSLQYHNKKDESIYVLRGEIVLRFQQGDTLIERPMREGEAFHIQPRSSTSSRPCCRAICSRPRLRKSTTWCGSR